MSFKYEIVKRVVRAVGLKNRGKMTADEMIAFKKKQNARIGIPDIRDNEITVSQVSVMGFPALKMSHKSFTGKAKRYGVKYEMKRIMRSKTDTPGGLQK